MKKIIFYSLLLISVGCKKDQKSQQKNLPKDSQKAIENGIARYNDSSKPADSTISGSFNDRPKTTFATTCAKSNIALAPVSPTTYTIIGNYPTTTTGQVTVLPRTTWVSPNGQYRVVTQQDGNLVLYKGTGSNALWASKNTFQKNTQFRLQTDLNFVAYVGNTGVWDSGTQVYHCTNHLFPQNLPKNARLVLRNDGDMQIIADGRDGWNNNYTVVLGGTRTYGGQSSPNNGVISLDYTAGPSPTGVDFVYY